MKNLTGQSIDRYRILEQLGQGGMAVVYKAYDTRLEREVAIKVIRPDAIPQEQHGLLLQRFEREAKAQANFDHMHIVPVFDYGEYEDAPYLVMAYRPGGTLKALTGAPMPYQRAATLLAPIASALEYAYQRGVLHRDVKPSNILIDEQGEPALTDFGIAKLLEGDDHTLTGSGLVMGTPGYIAPEQWRGEALPQSDVYGLGVIFYELVAGRRPYEPDTPVALMIMQVTDPLPLPSELVPGLPPHVEQVILKALAIKPEDRYESMAAFEVVLGSFTDRTQPKIKIALSEESSGPLAGVPRIAETLDESDRLDPISTSQRADFSQVTGDDFAGAPLELGFKAKSNYKSLSRPGIWIAVIAGIVFLGLVISIGGDVLGYQGGFTALTDSTAVIPTSIERAVAQQPTKRPVPSETVTSQATQTPTKRPTSTSVPSETPMLTESGVWEPCPGAYISRLHVEDLAYVSYYPPLANKVRSRPGTNRSEVGKIKPGEEVKIIDGPECANGWVWWKIKSLETNLVGWTSEGDKDAYWLVPEN